MANPTSKEKLIEKIEALNAQEAKEALIKIFRGYLNPAFGALPKRENEIIMFQALQELKIFDKNPDLYSLLSSLRITRGKARTLLYESNLRQDFDLELELLEILKKPVLLKENDKVCLEIDNPLLIDHLKHVLKELGHITDGSFSPDLVKLTPDAYKKLLNNKFDKISKKELKKALIECGAEKELTVKSILTSVLKKVGKKVADDAGDKAGEYIGDYLGELFDSGFKIAAEFVKENISTEVKLIEE
jgi:hypothetical protein